MHRYRYVEEMTRVLKPGGQIVIATWCQRDEGDKPFDEAVCPFGLSFIHYYSSPVPMMAHL